MLPSLRRKDRLFKPGSQGKLSLGSVPPAQEAERARADFETVLKGATILEREYIWVTK
jgi:hypothetical protein